MQQLSEHFQSAATAAAAADSSFSIICSAGGTEFKAMRLLECLSRVRFDNQGLNMAVERYMCRRTPDCAALSLQADHVVRDIYKWTAALFGPAGSHAAADKVAEALQSACAAPLRLSMACTQLLPCCTGQLLHCLAHLPQLVCRVAAACSVLSISCTSSPQVHVLMNTKVSVAACL